MVHAARLGFPFPRLDPIFLHCHWSWNLKDQIICQLCRLFEEGTHIMEFVVEAACIANRLAVVISSPECGVGCSAICAFHAGSSTACWDLGLKD